MREETEKILLADCRYPGFGRSSTRSGLQTLRDAGVWEILFPSVAYDEAAVCAMKALPDCGLPVRMALLCRSAEVEAAEAAMKRLCFSARQTAQTVSILRALRSLNAPLVEQAKLGPEALHAARAILAALEDPALAQLESSLARLKGRPMGLKELAVSGADLRPLFQQAGVPMREMGGMLEALWSAVLEGETVNCRDALLQSCVRRLKNA